MSKLEDKINQHGYKISDFSVCQLEVIQEALNNKLDLSTIINPEIDETIMSVVVSETISNSGQLSILPYLYSGINFRQIKCLRFAIENKDTEKLNKYLAIFKSKKFSDSRKYALSILITNELYYKDLLNSELEDPEFTEEVKSRLSAHKLKYKLDL
jgi:hypothetical protein